MNLHMDWAEMHHFCEHGMSHSLVVYVLQLHVYPHYIYTYSHIYNVRIDTLRRVNNIFELVGRGASF